MKHYDVVIAGGGLVGASLALALADTKLNVAIIEATDFAATVKDPRLLVLTKASQKIFTALGVWQRLVKTLPIDVIHVSYQGRFGRAKFTADEFDIDDFGSLIQAAEVLTTLREQVASNNIDVIDRATVAKAELVHDQYKITAKQETELLTVTAKLLVAADGANSTLVKQQGFTATCWDYQQTALIATVTLANQHPAVAYERFLPDGHLALLPSAAKQMNLIWVVDNQKLPELQQKTDAEFLALVQNVFGYRLGRMTGVSKRTSYPLKFHYLDQPIAERLVVIGNAAHTIHPLAAQGFNLGLRDVACLAEMIIQAKQQQQDIGGHGLLADYLAWRKDDYQAIIRFVNRNVFWLQQQIAPINMLRDFLVLATDIVPAIKKPVALLGMGLKGRLPKLACGVSIK